MLNHRITSPNQKPLVCICFVFQPWIHTHTATIQNVCFPHAYDAHYSISSLWVRGITLGEDPVLSAVYDVVIVPGAHLKHTTMQLSLYLPLWTQPDRWPWVTMSFLSRKQRGRAPIQHTPDLVRSRLSTSEMQMFFITSHAGCPAHVSWESWIRPLFAVHILCPLPWLLTTGLLLFVCFFLDLKYCVCWLGPLGMFVCLCFVFWDRASLCSLSFPGTLKTLEFIEPQMPLPPECWN